MNLGKKLFICSWDNFIATSTDMYVKFNNIFEDKRKLNSLLKKNNYGQKTESSLDMFSRLLANASSQGHASQFPNKSNNNSSNNNNQGHAAQFPKKPNNNDNNFYPAYHGVRYPK